jgi:Ca2+-binding EF-hand superfamily protein
MGILLAAVINPVYSSDNKNKQDYSAHFGDIDLNGDDQVKWKEFEKYFPHAEEDVFKKADANNDGSIDHDEWHNYKAAQGYGHKK